MLCYSEDRIWTGLISTTERCHLKTMGTRYNALRLHVLKGIP